MTIKDVAQHSGYAVGTVSRVLNGHPDVSEEARSRILAVVEELGFKPNSNARHLKQRGGNGFCILVKGTHNMLFMSIVEEMQSLIKRAGRSASVYYLNEDDNEVELGIQVYHEQKPLGILFLGGNQDNFKDRFTRIACPCVLVTARADMLGFSNLSSVSTDDVEGAKQAMGALLDAGHRKVGIIGSDSGEITANTGSISRLRLLGCQKASEKRGLTFYPQQAVASRYSMEGGYQAAQILLDRYPDMTAIFAISDVMAIGALRAIHDRGLRVPEDLSLIGYDGIEQVDYCVPRLSTIRQDVEQLARRGVDILLKQIDGAQAVHEIVSVAFIQGESVRTIRA